MGALELMLGCSGVGFLGEEKAGGERTDFEFFECEHMLQDYYFVPF